MEEEWEDIKVLETYLDTYDRKFLSKKQVKILNAIENLIERNEWLEHTRNELLQRNKELKEKKNIYYYEWKHLEANVVNDYISKDKIRKKIEELEKMSISQDIYYDDIKKCLKNY